MSEFSARWLPLLQTLPAPLAALLMQGLQRSDVMFPREKRELESTLESLRPPRSPEMERAVAAFKNLSIPTGMSASAWQTEPAAWVEKFTAAMWSTGQIEAYRDAAKLTLPRQMSSTLDAAPRAVVIVFEKRLMREAPSATLFRRLQPAGTLFTAVRGEKSRESLAEWFQQRARRSQERYAHWYISGNSLPILAPTENLASLSYAELQPARQRLLQMMNAARNTMGTGGPEGLRHAMQTLTPDEMGLASATDPVLRAFATDILVGGSGTQLYSTTFVQWTAREILRRAQPRTLVAEFTARNQSASMDLRLAQPTKEPPLDFEGSLVDAEMGAYLTYLNLLRLPCSERSHFVAWHEGYGQAIWIGGSASRGTQSVEPIQLSALLKQIA